MRLHNQPPSHHVDGRDTAERRDEHHPSQVEKDNRRDGSLREHPHDGHEMGEREQRKCDILECCREEREREEGTGEEGHRRDEEERGIVEGVDARSHGGETHRYARKHQPAEK